MTRHILIFLLLLSVLVLAACQNDGSDKNPINIQLSDYDTVSFEGPAIEFDTTAYDFGKVYEGEKVGWNFKYKNPGNKNLVLTNVTTSCGCTIPAYSDEPVAPGKEGEIKVVFDTYGKSGHQYKTVSIETNGKPGSIELIVTAEVIKK